MRIVIGSDRAAFDCKERMELYLVEIGHEVVDLGTEAEVAGSFPLVVRPIAEAVAEGDFDRGLVFGLSADGAAVAANRVPGVRCIAGSSVKAARHARREFDANMLALGHCLPEFERAREIVDAWLETPFDAPRHARELPLFDAHAAVPALANALPRRATVEDEASYVCDSCRSEFQIAIDPSGGERQEFVEDCPVCCHPNRIHVRIDGDGLVLVTGEIE
ncbi:MAG: CPXCG motif-containing cysteine-rich protein [Planctomycetales bacterium]